MKLFMENNPTERTEYYINKMFVDEEHNFDEEVTLYIPFDIYINTLKKYCQESYYVELKGSDTDIWDLFSDTNFLDLLFEDYGFIDCLTKAYENSGYPELDYQNWQHSKPWEE